MSDNLRPCSSSMIRSVALVVLVFAGNLAAAETLRPAACVTLPRPQDQVWLLSSHAAGCDPLRLDFRQFVGGRWAPSDRQTFLAVDGPVVNTAIYIHGYRTSIAEASKTGWHLYSDLLQTSGPEPLRLVIYSWPSEPNSGRPIVDARAKAAHTDIEGHRLAFLISEMPPQTPVSLIGHSFGARVVTSALHLLGGGQICARSLGATFKPQHRPLRAVLLAAALDNDWLLPGRPYGRAVSQVDQMLIFYNPRGRVLTWYPLLSRGGPEALGATGLVGASRWGAEAGKIRQVNASGFVGPSHAVHQYLQSYPVIALLQSHVAAR